MTSSFVSGVFQGIGPSGQLASGKLYTYAKGSTSVNKNTYPDSSLTPGTENPNPITLNSAGQAAVWLEPGPYHMVLKGPGGTVTIWDADNIQEPVESTVNVLDFMTAVQLDDVLAGTLSQDVTGPVQAALTAAPMVYFPNGKYKITSTLIARVDSHLIGQNRIQTQLQGTFSGTILQFPVNNNQCIVEGLYFGGAACTGIAVDTSQTGQSLNGYFSCGIVRDCQFGWELSFGINFSSNQVVIEDNNFGQSGSGAVGAHNFVAIRMFQVPGTSNSPNATVIRANGIFNAGLGTAATGYAAIELNGPVRMSMLNNNLEGNGAVLYCNAGGEFEFVGNWLERNGSGAPQELLFQDSYLPIYIARNHFAGGSGGTSVNAIVAWNGNTNSWTPPNLNAGLPGGFIFANNFFGLPAGKQPFYNYQTGIAVTYALDQWGRVQWYDNIVTGTASFLQQGLQFRGNGAPRLVLSVSAAGTILKTTDPTVAITSFSSGLATIVNGNPLVEAIGAAPVIATVNVSSGGSGVAVSTTNLFTIQVTTRNSSGAATNEAFTLIVF